MEIYIHAENFTCDSLDNTACAVKVQLPALPRKGDTLFLDTELQRTMLTKILSKKRWAQNWCNLMYEHWDGCRYYTLQGFFNVKDVWFHTSDGGSVHVLVGADERMAYHEITDEVFILLQNAFRNGKMFF